VGGSGINSRFDVGVYEPADNHRESIPMGSLSTVFQAEVMAILRCRELLLSKNIMRWRIHFCCDNRTAVAALAKSTTESALVWKNMRALEKLSCCNKVTLVWLPRHHGILVNEEADKLAKEGTNGVPSDHTVGIPFVVGKAVIRSHLREEHLNRGRTVKVVASPRPS
jgi:ribonuclease HI